MTLQLHIPGLAPADCSSYRHHVHTELTRAPRSVDPRVPGRSRHDAFSVTRSLDHLTPHLAEACASGRRLERVELVVQRPDEEGQPQPWFRFEMRDVYVTGLLDSVEDEIPLETVTFDYGAITWCFEGEDAADSRSWRVHGDP